MIKINHCVESRNSDYGKILVFQTGDNSFGAPNYNALKTWLDTAILDECCRSLYQWLALEHSNIMKKCLDVSNVNKSHIFFTPTLQKFYSYNKDCPKYVKSTLTYVLDGQIPIKCGHAYDFYYNKDTITDFVIKEFEHYKKYHKRLK